METGGGVAGRRERGHGGRESGAALRNARSDPSSRLPRMIWVLGAVSLFMDTSSELVHSLLPVLMTTTLGASIVAVGVIEGAAEATASVAKVFSGTLSDAARSRKWLVVAGYGLAALTKPVFPLAPSVGWVFGARFVDRVGKGMRGAPRDALVADVVPAHQRGAAYGLRQALDSVGAFAGPLLAVLAMGWFAADIRAVLWMATAPAAIAVLLLVLGVQEPARPHHRPVSRRWMISRADVRSLPRRYWHVVALSVVFTVARFSEAFLILRASDVGLAVAHVPAVLIVMNAVYASVAYPAGRAADRVGATTLLVAGLAVLVAADAVLALATTPRHVLAATAAWGAHMGLTQGLFAKLIADAAPASLRGTGFGIFHLATGVSLLLASTTAGVLWAAAGPPATFVAGGACAALAMIGIAAYDRRRRQATTP